MKRKRSHDCDRWLKNPKRKPLIVRGARQVGKTWLVRDLARRQGYNLVEINLERRPELATLFESNDPIRICRLIDATLGVQVRSTSSLLFVDEIQAVPEIIAKLRWFYEEMPDLPVVAAGSLLEFALKDQKFSMPVGRISYLHLEPLSFFEWLRACGGEALVDEISSWSVHKPMPTALHQRAEQLFQEYLIIGGLPAVVEEWHRSQDLQNCMELQHELVATYRDDFNKYSGRISPSVLAKTLASAALQLGKKFVYSQVDPELRGSSVKAALDLLCQAKICHRVEHTAGNGIPLAAEVNEKRFKVIMIDCGLVSALLQLGRLSPLEDLTFSPVYRGGLIEQFVGQQLRVLPESFREPSLYYWQREHGRRGELDYLVQHGTHVIPLEVKSGSAGRMKSLHHFMAEKGLSLAIKSHQGEASLKQVALRTTQGQPVAFRLLSLPIYAIERIPELLTQIL